MKTNFSEAEVSSATAITQDLLGGQVERGIERLRALTDEIHAAIPERLRIGRGITWVVERVSKLLLAQDLPDEMLQELSLHIYTALKEDDLLIGVPIYLTAEYGIQQPVKVFNFFENSAGSSHWVVREFTAGAFRRIIEPNKDVVLPWLQKMAQDSNPNRRRFASETLRPVTQNKWLFRQPDYSLSVLRLMFRESHPYPRTSVGNNLSDLSRRLPELILEQVRNLVVSGDVNSYWIAYRTCRNLVKKEPQRVMKLLRVEEYHYKDRNFYMKEREVPIFVRN